MRLVIRDNGDDVLLAWKPQGRIDGCRGFALFRRRNGVEEVVRTWVGFRGDPARPGERRASVDWPIQKFLWSDYMVQPGDRVRYRVVPMVGPSRDALRPEAGLASDWSAEALVSPKVHEGLSVYFNRGIVAAQWLARRLGPGPAAQKQRALGRSIETPGDPIRKFLAGPLGQRLLSLLDQAAKGQGHLYAALYELDDPQIVDLLLRLRHRAHLVLANGSVASRGQDQNAKVRKLLRSQVELHDRMICPPGLGHNKFLVFCDPDRRPLAVWTGSANFTRTGLCTQANNALFIEDKLTAEAYLEQWERLRQAGDQTPPELIQANSLPRDLALGDVQARLWFTPTAQEADLEEARQVIGSARQGVLFLMFNPGPRRTLLNAILDLAQAGRTSPPLYIHGVLNQDPGVKDQPVELFHRGHRVKADFEVVLPEAIDERLAFWVEEIKKWARAMAMVHSKVVVVDPFGPEPAVITGSHNLGPKASAKNDENLLIIRRAPELAQAYAVNVMSIYNQYRWRFHRLQSHHSKAWLGLQDDDRWQDDYLTTGEKGREIDFWLGGQGEGQGPLP